MGLSPLVEVEMELGVDPSRDAPHQGRASVTRTASSVEKGFQLQQAWKALDLPITDPMR